MHRRVRYRSMAMRTTRGTLLGSLSAIVGADAVLEPRAEHLVDATENRGIKGRAEAVVLPSDAQALARVLAWSDAHGVPVTPRGGGTGYAGGAVPLDGGIVLGLERLRRVRSFEPAAWRICVEAGLRTAELRRLARESGLLFAPDPGAAEQSQIGGNIATNAGGPHAFKYGVTGAWVIGLEAVLATGELIALGGPIRKDVAGYDLRGLLVGSEGTLAVITAAWLKLIPAPQAALPVYGLYPDTASGCAAIARVLEWGLAVAALEYLDAPALALAGAAFPGGAPAHGAFLVLAEADGSTAEARRIADELADCLAEDALAVHAPRERAEVAALWRWREGVSLAVAARRGGKVSEDIVVPFERLAEAVEQTRAIGARHGLEACSWGHAGDGNLHSTFLVDPTKQATLAAAHDAAGELFELAVTLGGSASGEHGIGVVKRGALARQWAPGAVALHGAIKRAFDPKNLLNPGKKLAL
jgi:glycolate oxidase subunit GlcD